MTHAQGTTEWTAHDLFAWEVLRPLLDAGGYLPWSTGAMRASGLVTLCNEIVLDDAAAASWTRSSTTSAGRSGCTTACPVRA
jgi:hypothetical protein